MLKTYMGFDCVGGSQEGAVLIFAHDRREAKKLAHQTMRCWYEATEFIHTRVRLLKDKPWLYVEADKEKLARDEPHAIDALRSSTCKRCELWGLQLDEGGICTECRAEE